MSTDYPDETSEKRFHGAGAEGTRVGNKRVRRAEIERIIGQEGEKMSYTAVEAIVKRGKIYPSDPASLPEEGRVLVIVLEGKKSKPNPKTIASLLGWLKTDLDAVRWQREIRSEWDARP